MIKVDIGSVKTVKVHLWLLALSKLTYLGGGGWISTTKTGKTTCDSLVWTLYQPQGSAINDYADTSGMNILSMLRFFLSFYPVFKAQQTETSGKFDISSPHCVQPLFRWCPVTQGGIPLPSPGPCSAEDGEIRLRRPGDRVDVYRSGILTPSLTSKQCCRPTARPHGRDETMRTGPAEVCESTRLSSATCRCRLTGYIVLTPQ